MWTKPAIKTALAVALLSFSGAAAGIDLACEQPLEAAPVTSLPKKDYSRFLLSDELTCHWSSEKQQATHSLLFSAPSSQAPVEIEIGSWLTVDKTTATHIALLDKNFAPIKWIPFESFRERKNYLTARFFVNPGDETRYILVGGALGSEAEPLVRTYSPLSSNVLRVAGLITAREVSSRFTLVPEGKIRVRIRKPKEKRIPIID